MEVVMGEYFALLVGTVGFGAYLFGPTKVRDWAPILVGAFIGVTGTFFVQEEMWKYFTAQDVGTGNVGFVHAAATGLASEDVVTYSSSDRRVAYVYPHSGEVIFQKVGFAKLCAKAELRSQSREPRNWFSDRGLERLYHIEISFTGPSKSWTAVYPAHEKCTWVRVRESPDRIVGAFL